MTNLYSISRWHWKWTNTLFFPPSGIYYSQQCYNSRLLWFKIIKPTVQTDGEGHDTRGIEGATPCFEAYHTKLRF
jgi:hypothetical protein